MIEALDRGDPKPARFGLTITKKVGNAVERNRIRRRLREAIRTACRDDMVPGFDYVIVARRDLLRVPFEVVTGELSRRFSRARAAAPARSSEPARGRSDA
jgi:ribonuclease P protein component